MRSQNLLVLITFFVLAAGQPFGAGGVVSTIATGKGRTLVFLPGLGCPPEVWTEVTNTLSNHYRCVQVGIGGFAGSPASGSFRIDALVQAIGDVLSTGQPGHPILIGHSFGGFLALQVAARYPNRLSGLLIVDAYPFPMGALQPGMSPEQARAQAQKLQQIFEQLPDPAFRTQEAASLAAAVRDEARRAQILDWICRTNRAIYAQGLAAQLGSDLREILPRITAPALVLGTWPSGQSLGWNRENTEQRLADQYKGLARLQVRVHESARHFIMFDDPAGLIRTIQEFAAGHE